MALGITVLVIIAWARPGALSLLLSSVSTWLGGRSLTCIPSPWGDQLPNSYPLASICLLYDVEYLPGGLRWEEGSIKGNLSFHVPVEKVDSAWKVSPYVPYAPMTSAGQLFECHLDVSWTSGTYPYPYCPKQFQMI